VQSRPTPGLEGRVRSARLSAPIDALALVAIRFYQRHLSPLKGYGCAYRVHTGCASCSHLGYRAIRRYGLWIGLPVLQQRLHRCAVAHARFGLHGGRQARTPPPGRALSGQAGVCDLACDLPCSAPCELPCAAPLDAIDWDCLGFACDVGDCCNGWRRKKVAKDDALVHIPLGSRRPRRPASSSPAESTNEQRPG